MGLGMGLEEVQMKVLLLHKMSPTKHQFVVTH